MRQSEIRELCVRQGLPEDLADSIVRLHRGQKHFPWALLPTSYALRLEDAENKLIEEFLWNAPLGAVQDFALAYDVRAKDLFEAYLEDKRVHDEWCNELSMVDTRRVRV